MEFVLSHSLCCRIQPQLCMQARKFQLCFNCSFGKSSSFRCVGSFWHAQPDLLTSFATFGCSLYRKSSFRIIRVAQFFVSFRNFSKIASLHRTFTLTSFATFGCSLYRKSSKPGDFCGKDL